MELQELTSVAAAIGLWDLVPVFSFHRGYPHLLLNAIKSRSDICRGALVCLLRQKCLVPILLEENGQWFFDFIAEKCNKLDTIILKVRIIIYNMYISSRFICSTKIKFYYYSVCAYG